jgi:surface antigen
VPLFDSHSESCSIDSCAFICEVKRTFAVGAVMRDYGLLTTNYEYEEHLGGVLIMSNTVIKVGLFMCAMFLLTTQSSHALSNNTFALTDDPLGNKAWEARQEKIAEKERQDAKEAEESKAKELAEQKAAEKAALLKEQEPTTYTIVQGDNLSKIASSHNTTWQRIYAKNTAIDNPNTITVGQSIVIPNEGEVLEERALPTPAPVVMVPASSTPQTTTIATTTRRQAPASSAGNTYAPGYCTWYAKSRRPDLPNRMGNAISWVSSAAAQGFATGSTPRAGAIGQRGNHVVYVENVNGDGTVTVSEMNYKGLYIVSSRTVAASSFTYIY